MPPRSATIFSITGWAIGAPEPLVAATPPPRPPPQVTTGMSGVLAAARPAPIEEQGKTMSTMAPAPRSAKFWIEVLA